MATVAILVNPARTEARDLAGTATSWLQRRGHRARLLRMLAPDLVVEDGVEGALAGVDLRGTELAVSLGGDGTFLKLVPLAWAAGTPLLGVNFGRLGFLLEVQPPQLLESLERALAGELDLDERAVLSVAVGSGTEQRSGQPARSWVAFNEIALEKTVFGHTVRLATAVDGEPFLTYSADGLLIATPSGSTAYNLSAGGPVISPRLRAMVVTPIAPHLTLDRSLVLHPDQTVTVRIRDGRPAVLVVDGNEAGRLAPGDEVSCRVAAEPVRLVTMGHQGLGRLIHAALELGDAD